MRNSDGQILLTLIFLVSAVIFVLLSEEQLAIALVGAVIGQSASVGVQGASNGK